MSFMGTPNRISETKQTGVAYANTPHTSDIYSEAMYKIICGGWGGGQRLTRVGKSRRDIRLAEKSGHAGGGTLPVPVNGGHPSHMHKERILLYDSTLTSLYAWNIRSTYPT